MWSGTSLVIVTGASRGIGKELALQFSEKIGPGSKIVLIARDSAALASTREAILSASNGKVSVDSLSIDLGLFEHDDFYPKLAASCKAATVATDGGHSERRGLPGEHLAQGEYSRAFLIHNAGTLGIIDKKVVELGDPQSIEIWKSYYDLHIHSVNALNAAFFALFPNTSKVIINITSLAAVAPIPGWSMYCSARAAREAIFRNLALEEGDDVVVLSYSPGPVDTDMLSQVRNESMPETKEMMERATVVSAEQTVAKLITVLDERSFKNGGRVDYFDV